MILTHICCFLWSTILVILAKCYADETLGALTFLAFTSMVTRSELDAALLTHSDI